MCMCLVLLFFGYSLAQNNSMVKRWFGMGMWSGYHRSWDRLWDGRFWIPPWGIDPALFITVFHFITISYNRNYDQNVGIAFRYGGFAIDIPRGSCCSTWVPICYDWVVTGRVCAFLVRVACWFVPLFVSVPPGLPRCRKTEALKTFCLWLPSTGFPGSYGSRSGIDGFHRFQSRH